MNKTFNQGSLEVTSITLGNGDYEAVIWIPELSNQFAVAFYYDGDKVGLTRHVNTLESAKKIARKFINSKC